MKVTDDPEQVGLLPAVTAIDTAGTNTGFTVIVTVFETALAGAAHVAFEIIVHTTDCPLVMALVVYVGLLVPTGDPPTVH